MGFPHALEMLMVSRMQGKVLNQQRVLSWFQDLGGWGGLRAPAAGRTTELRYLTAPG